MLKLVRGIKGREKPTGSTLLQTWQDFEDETSFIWSNARLYNEDGSEISELAGQLEVSPNSLLYFRVLIHSVGILQEATCPSESSC